MSPLDKPETKLLREMGMLMPVRALALLLLAATAQAPCTWEGGPGCPDPTTPCVDWLGDTPAVDCVNSCDQLGANDIYCIASWLKLASADGECTYDMYAEAGFDFLNNPGLVTVCDLNAPSAQPAPPPGADFLNTGRGSAADAGCAALTQGPCEAESFACAWDAGATPPCGPSQIFLDAATCAQRAADGATCEVNRGDSWEWQICEEECQEVETCTGAAGGMSDADCAGAFAFSGTCPSEGCIYGHTDTCVCKLHTGLLVAEACRSAAHPDCGQSDWLNSPWVPELGLFCAPQEGACAPNAVYDAVASCESKSVSGCTATAILDDNTAHNACAVRDSSCEVSMIFMMSALCSTAGGAEDCGAIRNPWAGGWTGGMCAWVGGSCALSGEM